MHHMRLGVGLSMCPSLLSHMLQIAKQKKSLLCFPCPAPQSQLMIKSNQIIHPRPMQTQKSPNAAHACNTCGDLSKFPASPSQEQPARQAPRCWLGCPAVPHPSYRFQRAPSTQTAADWCCAGCSDPRTAGSQPPGPLDKPTRGPGKGPLAKLEGPLSLLRRGERSVVNLLNWLNWLTSRGRRVVLIGVPPPWQAGNWVKARCVQSRPRPNPTETPRQRCDGGMPQV